MEAQRAEIKDHQEKLLKQAEMRREFLQINTQLKDIKNIEKDLVKMEIKQVSGSKIILNIGLPEYYNKLHYNTINNIQYYITIYNLRI